jgi:microcystin-dependent protein
VQNGQILDKNSGVLKVTLITGPQLYPQSAASVNAAQQYYCLALDIKGFQVQIDLQCMPPGMTLSQIKSNQVWWVEKRTTQYRLYLYGGIYNPSIRQVVSTSGLIISPNGDLNGTYNIPIVTGLQGIPVVSGQPTVGQTLTYTTSGWSPATPSVATGVPTGTLLDFAGATPPTGYLLCDGSSYSTTTYSGLFSTISYTWGGSGVSFNVPDLRGRTTIGAGSGTGLTFRALATYSGEETHVLVSGETPLAAHSHGFSVPAQTSLTTSTGTANTVNLNTAGGNTGSGTTGSGIGTIATGSTASNTTGISVASTAGTLTAAGQTATITDTGHKHEPSNGTLIGNNASATLLGNGVAAGGGYKYVGRYAETTVSVQYTSNVTTGITVSNAASNVTGTISSTVTDNGHTHSLVGVSIGIPSLTVNSLSIASQAVTGSVSIPGLAFTVPAQNSLTTSNNTATTASGHNNMQPYAVVTKIIKY